MSGTIIITKNSTTTSSPGQGNLNQGELAYSFLSQKLFIGDASDPVNDIIIGGKHFTDMLDHTLGTLTASSAILTDSSNKIDVINIDNITIDGNSIVTTNANGNLTLDPNGSGSLDIQADTDIVGNLTVSGTQNFTGQTTLASVNVLDLTDGRVLLGGVSGEVEDSGNLTFDGTILTVTGNTTTTGNGLVNGTFHVDGQSTLASVSVEDLTSGRVTLAGASGELQDSANLTFNGSTLTVTGSQLTTGNITINGTLDVDTSATIATLTVEDLTDNRVVLAGAGGEIEDSSNLTFDGSTLAVTGNETITGTLDVDGQATVASLNVEDLTPTRLTYSGASGELKDSANLTFDGTLLTVTGNEQVTGTFNVDGQSTLASLNVEDLTSSRITYSGASGELKDSAGLTFDGATLFVDGAIDVDNIKLDGNVIKSTDANGGLTIQPSGSGVVKINTDTGLVVPSGLVATRPTAASIGNGAVRYNESTNRFEGTVSGYWTGLGGVVDIDQDTYVTAEEGADDDTLRFYAGGTEEMKVEASGVTVTDQITVPTATITTAGITTATIGTAGITTETVGTSTIGTLNVTGDTDLDGDLLVGGNTIMTGNLTVNGTTTSVNSSITTLNDPVIKVGDGSALAGDSLDRGINLDYGDGSAVKTGFFGMDMQTKRFSFKPDSSVTTEDYSAPWGDAQFSGIFLGTTGQMEIDATGTMVSGTIDCGTF